MGTNIGTSLTSTVIALYHIKQSNEYRLGFTAAIMTDLFNWMTVLVLLPLEMATGFLAWLSKLLVDKILTDDQTSSSHLAPSNTLSFLDAILDPLVDSIVILKPASEQLNNCKLPSPAVLAKLSKLAKLSISDGDGPFGRAEESFGGEENSSAEESEENSLETGSDDSMESVEDDLMENSMSSSCSILATNCDGGPCNFLFAGSSLTDEAIGAIILVFTIVIFIGSFMIMVRR